MRIRSLLKEEIRVIWSFGDCSSRKEKKGVYIGYIVEERVRLVVGESVMN